MNNLTCFFFSFPEFCTDICNYWGHYNATNWGDGCGWMTWQCPSSWCIYALKFLILSCESMKKHTGIVVCLWLQLRQTYLMTFKGQFRKLLLSLPLTCSDGHKPMIRIKCFVSLALCLFFGGWGACWILKFIFKSWLKALKTWAVKGQLSCWQAQLATKRALFIDLLDKDLHWHFPLLSIWKSPGLTLQLSISKAQSNCSFWYSVRPAFWGHVALGIIKKKRW